jgi:SAM-dependent methyltransferase
MSNYDPLIYDLFHDPAAADVQFYTDLARQSGGPVLELGVGTGRTLLSIARSGIEIHGLDVDPSMLDALRRKLDDEPTSVAERVQVFSADMRQFSLPHRYAAIHIPFRAFLHNVDAAAQVDCLRACFDHLRPGGQLAFNVFHPSLEVMSRNHGALGGVWRWTDERILSDGRRILLSFATTYDTPAQKLSSRHRYEVYSASGVLERTHLLSLELAYLYPADVRERLASAGFVEVRIDGGFGGGPLSRDGDELVVRALRPA